MLDEFGWRVAIQKCSVIYVVGRRDDDVVVRIWCLLDCGGVIIGQYNKGVGKNRLAFGKAHAVVVGNLFVAHEQGNTGVNVARTSAKKRVNI
jgi:hypothetical protein